MKIKKIIAMTLVAGMSLSLLACSKEEKRIDPKMAEEEKKQFVSELLNEEGEKIISYQDAESEGNYVFEYKYALPELLIDSDDAKNVNQEILTKYKEPIEAFISNEDTVDESRLYESVTFSEISYDAYISDDVFSLVVKSKNYFDPVDAFEVFNFDVKTGKQLSDEKLLEFAGFSKEEFEKAYKKAAIYMVDGFLAEANDTQGLTKEEIEQLSGRFLDTYISNVHCRQDCLDLKCDSNNAVFMDDTGSLNAVVKVNVDSGFGVIVDNVKLEKESAVKLKISSQAGAAFSYKDGEAIITIASNDSTKKMPKSKDFKFGKDYEVLGLYKNYIDAAFVETESAPVLGNLVLLSDDGMIAYMDIDNGVSSGSFAAFEPLYNCYGVDELNDKTLDKIAKLIDKYYKGNKDMYTYYCLGLYDELESFSTTVTHKTDGGGEYDSIYNLGLRGNNREIFEFQDNYLDGEAMTYTGTLRLTGICDKGMVYTYVLDSCGGEPLSKDEIRRGSFAIKNHGFYNEEQDFYDDGMDLYYLSGDDLFGAGVKNISFSRTQG